MHLDIKLYLKKGTTQTSLIICVWAYLVGQKIGFFQNFDVFGTLFDKKRFFT